jgi:hypothetical protein
MATENKNLSDYDKIQSQTQKIFALGLLFQMEWFYNRRSV